MSEQMDPSRVNSVREIDLQSSSKRELPNLHAMQFGELLDTTFSLYRTHFRSFLAITSCSCLAMFLIFAVVYFDNTIGRSARGAIWIPTIGAFLGVFIFVISGLMFACAEAYLGRDIKIGTVLRQTGYRFLRCFAGALLFGLLAVLLMFFSLVLLTAIFGPFLGNSSDYVDLPFILCVIAILLGAAFIIGWFLTYWCFFTAAVLVEGELIGSGLRRSHELVGGDWWRIVGTMFAIFLLHLAVGVIFRIAIGTLLNLTGYVDVMEFLRTTQWTTLLQLLINTPELSFSYVVMFFINLGIDIVTMPIWVIGVALLHFDQRIRKEGFDIEVMAIHRGE